MPKLEIEVSRNKIREIVKTGRIDVTRHCRERMYLRGVEMDDLISLLLSGDIEPGQEGGDDESQVFRIIGTDVEEEPLIAVVQIINEQKLLCITVF